MHPPLLPLLHVQYRKRAGMPPPGDKKATHPRAEITATAPQATHLGRIGGTNWAIAFSGALMGDAGHASGTDAGAYRRMV